MLYCCFVFEVLNHFISTGGPQSKHPIQRMKKTRADSRMSTLSSNTSVNEYLFQQTDTIYAKGSQRSLVLMNGKIKGSTAQDEIESKLLNS